MSRPTEGEWKAHDPYGDGFAVWAEDGRGLCRPPFGPNVPPGENEANMRLMAASKALASLAEAYEQWEAALIMSNEAWRGLKALPQLTEPLFDRLIELQAERNRILRDLRSNGVLDPAKPYESEVA